MFLRLRVRRRHQTGDAGALRQETGASRRENARGASRQEIVQRDALYLVTVRWPRVLEVRAANRRTDKKRLKSQESSCFAVPGDALGPRGDEDPDRVRTSHVSAARGPRRGHDSVQNHPQGNLQQSRSVEVTCGDALWWPLNATLSER